MPLVGGTISLRRDLRLQRVHPGDDLRVERVTASGRLGIELAVAGPFGFERFLGFRHIDGQRARCIECGYVDIDKYRTAGEAGGAVLRISQRREWIVVFVAFTASARNALTASAAS